MSQPMPPETLAQAAERASITRFAQALAQAHHDYAVAANAAIDAFVTERVAAHDAERTAFDAEAGFLLRPGGRRFPLGRGPLRG